MVFLLTACGSPKEENELYMTVGGTGIPNTVGVKHFYDFEQSVKEKLPTIETKMLVYGQLGSEENLVSGLRRNRVQFANLSAIIVSTLVPELLCFMLLIFLIVPKKLILYMIII